MSRVAEPADTPLSSVAPPTEAEVLEQIQRIALEELEQVNPIDANTKLRDLDLDSLTQTVLAVSLEDRFRVRLEVDDRLVTIGDLARLVVARAAERP